MTERGELLYEYRPPRAHPIIYAGLILTGFVWITGSVEVALRDAAPVLYLAYAAPFLAVLLWFLIWYPNDIHIHAHGIRPARPLWRRILPGRRFVAWSELAAVYPSYYDVTGAFVSPFASSDGKVTQLGLGLEHQGGRVEVVKFTPSRFTPWTPMSRGFEGALQAVRVAHERIGRPLTPCADTFDAETRKAMEAEARKEFLNFFAILALVASAAPVLWVLTRLGAPVPAALPVSLLLPLSMGSLSWYKSRQRNDILNRLCKAAEYERHTRGQSA